MGLVSGVTKHLHVDLPLYLSPVTAGFPSPADDFLDKRLDLNEYLVKNPTATYLVRATGESMKGVGIHDGDILVVDKSVEAADGKVVIAIVYGEFTVKTLKRRNGKAFLVPANAKISGDRTYTRDGVRGVGRGDERDPEDALTPPKKRFATMCGRFVLWITLAIPEHYGLPEPEEPILPSFNIAPGQICSRLCSNGLLGYTRVLRKNSAIIIKERDK